MGDISKKCGQHTLVKLKSKNDNILSFLASKYPFVSNPVYFRNLVFLPQTGQYKKTSEEETGVDPELLQVEYTRSF